MLFEGSTPTPLALPGLAWRNHITNCAGGHTRWIGSNRFDDFIELIESIQTNLTSNLSINSDVGYNGVEKTIQETDFSIRIINKVPQVVKIHHDPEGSFSMLEYLQLGKMNFKDYREFLKEYISTCSLSGFGLVT